MSFIEDIKKVKQKRNHRIKNSYGVYDAYKYYRKNKPKDKRYILNESQYFSIIRYINTLLIDKFLLESEIKFPKRMGSLYIKKNSTKIYTENNSLKNTYPIDWNTTLNLWKEDWESYNNKTIVKYISKEVFKIKYDKKKANYINKSFFDFKPNRSLKLKLKECIRNNNISGYE